MSDDNNNKGTSFKRRDQFVGVLFLNYSFWGTSTRQGEQTFIFNTGALNNNHKLFVLLYLYENVWRPTN